MKPTKTISQKDLVSLIPTGKENAVSMKYLADVLDVTERDIRQSVLDARCDGVIICGTVYGYYFPADESELREYYYYALTRALTSLKSLKATKLKVKEIEAGLSDVVETFKEELEE